MKEMEMCAKPEHIIDYRDLTPDEWLRERQQILSRAQAARAGALRELAHTLLRPWQALARLTALVPATGGKAWRAYARWRERREAVRELHALDDRSLRDIGVSRSEIEWVVWSQQAARVRAAVKAVRPRQHWPAPDRSTPAKPQQVGKGLTGKRAA
ncbi:MAG TPA: DUF1127 domain-containing protein [Xanthobacteraceae bacterium]|jgi:uncharacterized protein YjiS (DUF1127 family)|nr:DUF1127 domain-containing protein [Xanthobacteraceae bacterium]